MCIYNNSNKGSPPPMRGKAVFPFRFSSDFRITPAYAGKSCGHANTSLFVQDHPRLCGEKCNVTRRFSCVTGSPPPMRGKEHLSNLRLKASRITPAYAGKSEKHGISKKRSQDHPRLCGEKCPGIYGRSAAQGSPPPMRGKVACKDFTSPGIGITPAYAGKSRFP